MEAKIIKTQAQRLTIKQKLYIKINKIIKSTQNTDIDFLFLFLALFVLTPSLSLIQMLLGSIGLMYIYKLIVIDIIKIIIRGKMK